MTCLFLNKCLWIITEFIMHINWKVPVVAIKFQKQAYHGKWEVGIKLFQQTSKGFVNFNWRQSYSFIGFCAVRNTSIQHSIFQQSNEWMGLCCIDVRLVSGIAAVSPRFPHQHWNENPYLVTYDVITVSGLHTSTMSKAFSWMLWFEGEFIVQCWTPIKCGMEMLPATNQG